MPSRFADEAQIASFVEWLDNVGTPPWDRIADLSDDADQISRYRPFYPNTGGRKGNRRQIHLLNALGATSIEDLMRLCERRAKAACMFWTLGPRQSGRGAIAGWYSLLKPARVQSAGL